MSALFSETLRSQERVFEVGRGVYLAIFTASFFLAAWLLWLFLVSVPIRIRSESARLEVQQHPSPLHTRVAGYVVASNLAMGADVQRGATLVVLDSETQRLRLVEERMRCKGLRERMASLVRERESRIRSDAQAEEANRSALDGLRHQQTQANLIAKLAAKQAKRNQSLYAEGLFSEARHEQAQSKKRQTEAAAAIIVQRLRSLDKESEAEASQRLAQLEKLSGEIGATASAIEVCDMVLTRLEFEIEQRTIRAPISGRLAAVRSITPGMYLEEGEDVGRVVPTGHVGIVAEVEAAKALGHIVPGQCARMRLDGFAWTEFGSFQATVKRVDAELQNGRVRVELAISSNANTRLPRQHGLSGTVEIETEQVSPATLVLRAAGLAWPPTRTKDSQ